MKEKIYEEFNVPEWINIDMTEYYDMQENLAYYKTTIRMIEEEINSEDSDKKKIECIKEYIKELKNVIK